MLYDVVGWGWRRLRPTEGWLPLFLLLTIISVMASAVMAVDWVPETPIVVWASFWGLLFGSLLAKRRLSWPASWLIIILYGLLLVAVSLGRLSPPVSTLSKGWNASSATFRQNLGLFIDRIGGWIEAAYGGESSEETIVFAIGLGIIAWLLAAYAGWSTFRQRRPLAGLTAMGFALAINGYFGNAPIWPAILFVGLGALLTAMVHYAGLERGWSNKEIDYSTEIRLELLGYSGAIALMLLAVAYVLPAVNVRALTQAFRDRPAVQEAEEAFERAFAGVRQPLREPINIEPGGSGQRGALPRSFLLGAPPELYETVVMTATTGGDYPGGVHWRGFSYDIYTGRGWAISDERQQRIEAYQEIPLPETEEHQTVSQAVRWVMSPLATRYTLGLPLRFDQEVRTYWRGLEDLSRVQGRGESFRADSRVSVATAAELREAALDDVPPAVMARYTALPDNIPNRVHDLAQQVGGDPFLAPTPYDQARALERFLRQYPYSLEVELPPANADPVDFFLYDLQRGYCDYYASAMVVMARSLGLPARLAVGFLGQPADEKGVQTLYQINAHSWAEVYFAGYGWIEFEPTAAFPTRDAGQFIAVPPEFDRQEPLPLTYPPPIPEPEFKGVSPIWWLLAAILFMPVIWLIWKWRRGKAAPLDGVLWSYGRLQRSARRLGQHAPASQTPAEFEAAILAQLEEASRPKWQVSMRRGVMPDIKRLTATFVERQYGGRRPASDQARESWRRIRGRLWVLGIFYRVFAGDR